MKRVAPVFALVVAAAALLFYAAPSPSFVPEVTTGGGAVNKWTSTPTFTVNPSKGANITGATSVATVIANGFAVWTNAPNSSASAINGGTTSQTTISQNDHVNLVCFVPACTFPGGFGKDGTLAITETTSDNSTGQIVDADIIFNSAVNFVTDNSAAPNGSQSLPTVATHEIGHFFGLDHSGIARAMMFPFAPPFENTLAYDDVMGISALYPGAQSVATGTITGTIKNAAGAPVFGAHVFAESTTNRTFFTGNIRKSPIDTLTRPDGTYQLVVPSGDTYNVTAEPADGPVQTSNFDWSKAFGQASLNTSFTTRQR